MGTLQVASLPLSSAQLLDLHNTPAKIIPAPGVGLAIFPQHGLCIYRAGATPYTFDGAGFAELVATCTGIPQNLGHWGPWDFNFTPFTGVLDSATDIITTFGQDGSGPSQAPLADPADWENLSVSIYLNDGAQLHDGDGTVLLQLPYLVLATTT